MKCLICNSDFKNLGTHLRYSHKLKPKEYYDLYLLKDNENKCKHCGKLTNFNKLSKGYNKFCSVRCAAYFTQNKEDTRNKIKKTCLNRYGVIASVHLCSKKYRTEQTKKAVLKKYNVENVYQLPKIIQKLKNNKIMMYQQYEKENHCVALSTLINKYGTGWVQNTELNIKRVLYKHKIFIPLTEISKIEEYISKTKHNMSYKEILIYKILLKYFNNNEIKIHTRTIIKPLELDFYIHTIKLAIEYNSNYYHCIENGKPIDYHINKSIKCANRNIRLIHIYEFENFKEQLYLLDKYLQGFDLYLAQNFNKNNLNINIANVKNGIIYKNKRYTIYGSIY